MWHPHITSLGVGAYSLNSPKTPEEYIEYHLFKMRPDYDDPSIKKNRDEKGEYVALTTFVTKGDRTYPSSVAFWGHELKYNGFLYEYTPHIPNELKEHHPLLPINQSDVTIRLLQQQKNLLTLKNDTTVLSTDTPFKGQIYLLNFTNENLIKLIDNDPHVSKGLRPINPNRIYVIDPPSIFDSPNVLRQ